MSDAKTIAVAMSTYNGAEHLMEQLESIYAQEGCSPVVYVRDDGSSDSTPQILASEERAGRLHFLRGENKGVVPSFMEALTAVPLTFNYVALSDQDDVWHADKLSRAIEVLSARNNAIPQLYCAEYTFCDANMVQQGHSHLNQTGVDYAKMLYENMTSGNTMVMNRALVDLIVSAGPEHVYCHDWWISLVATALGELTYDDFSCLEYRRTGDNASPTGTSALNILRYRVNKFLNGEGLARITEQLNKLNECFGDAMDAEKRDLLREFLDGGRFAKAIAPVHLRQKLPEEIVLRLLFIAGKL